MSEDEVAIGSDILNRDAENEEMRNDQQVANIQENIFSHEGIRSLIKNMKEQEHQRAGGSQHDLYLGGIIEEDTLLYYGHHFDFEYKHLLDLRAKKATIDAKFSAGAEVRH